MTRIEKSPFPLNDLYRLCFQDFYPSGQIESVEYTDLPDCAIQRFEGASRRFISPKDYRPHNFHYYFHVTYEDTIHTWVAWQTKPIYPYGAETTLYLCDTLQNGEKIGHSEVRYNLTDDNPFFVMKPFVGYNETDPSYVKKGYGTRRLIVMNALSLALWNYPLHSDTLIAGRRSENESSETDLWKSLVAKGLVRTYIERNMKIRYVFIPDKNLYKNILSSEASFKVEPQLHTV